MLAVATEVTWVCVVNRSRVSIAERAYSFIGSCLTFLGALGLLAKYVDLKQKLPFFDYPKEFEFFQFSDSIGFLGIGLGLFASIDSLSITRREGKSAEDKFETSMSSLHYNLAQTNARLIGIEKLLRDHCGKCECSKLSWRDKLFPWWRR